MNPQSPKPSAPCTLPVVPAPAAVLPNEAAMATDEQAPPPPVANTESSATIIREQDRLMPVANVSRIMRQVLPPYAKISDDAKEMIQECVSEFISFVTGEANERCHAERRKTVTSEDIVWAMNRLGFDDYVAPLGTFLQRMRESEGAEERGPGRGSRRGSSVVALSAPPLINGCAPQQMHHPAAAVCRQQHPPHQGVSPPAGYYGAVRPVPRPVPGSSASGAPMHFGGRSYVMYGGGHSPAVVPCYGGGAAFVVQAAGGSQHVGFHADEASSSSNGNPPAGSAGSRA